MMCGLMVISCRSSDAPEETYFIQIDVNPVEGGVTVPGSDTYTEGSQVDILAEVNENWQFHQWSGDITSENNPLAVTVNRDLSLTAEFVPVTYSLNITIEGEGDVEQELIQQKSEEYEIGSIVELTAVAADGWFFAAWQGDLEGSENPEAIEMNSPKEVTAAFERKAFAFDLETTGEGEVSVELVSGALTDEGYLFESVLELTAKPAEGWEFSGWSGDLESDENPLTITIEENTSLTANFEIIGVKLTVDIEGEGTVEQEVVSQKTTNYEFGTIVELTALPANGWYFSGWEGDLEGVENPITIELEEDQEVTAVFRRQAFELTISSTGEGLVSSELFSGEETEDGFLFESVVELSATPDDGWELARWSRDIDSEENPIEIEILDNLSITAEFERKDYTLTIDVEGEGTVDTEVVQSKSTDFPFETEVKLTAVADYGWQFTEWTGDLTGAANPASLIMDEDKAVRAWFDRREFVLELQTQGDGTIIETFISGTETDDGYLFESVVELEAIPDDGWEFFEWTGGVTGIENPVTLEIDQDLTVTAGFMPESATISTTIEGEGSISMTLISGTETAGGYAIGSVLELQAVPGSNWEFVAWSGDVESANNPVQVEVTGDLEITAEFRPQAFDLNLQTSGNGSIDVELFSGETRGNQFVYLSEVELTAQADSDWQFANWSGDVESTDNPVLLVMDGDKNITANFEPFSNEYTVHLTFQDNQGDFQMQFGQSQNPVSFRRLAPPPPPAGALNAFFRYEGTNYVRDFRQDTETDIIWELRYQAGDGEDLEIKWNLDGSQIIGSLILTDEGGTFEIDMLEISGLSLPDKVDGVVFIFFSIE